MALPTGLHERIVRINQSRILTRDVVQPALAAGQQLQAFWADRRLLTGRTKAGLNALDTQLKVVVSGLRRPVLRIPVARRPAGISRSGTPANERNVRFRLCWRL